jgi:hypothetical protein
MQTKTAPPQKPGKEIRNARLRFVTPSSSINDALPAASAITAHTDVISGSLAF